MPYNSYPYELPPLPYAYQALEPHIDAETMYYHHDKHFRTYVENLNEALKPYPDLQKMTLTQLLINEKNLPPEAAKKIMDNGGGVYNHTFFFYSLSPAMKNNHIPIGSLALMMNDRFGSFEAFKEEFSQKAEELFGSGWTYLVMKQDGSLDIVNLKDQDTPLSIGAAPVIMFDVWEHAYYLKYKNQRDQYIEQLWNVITFPVIE